MSCIQATDTKRQVPPEREGMTWGGSWMNCLWNPKKIKVTGGALHWGEQGESGGKGVELEQLPELWARGKLSGPVDRRRLSGAAAVRRLSGPVALHHVWEHPRCGFHTLSDKLTHCHCAAGQVQEYKKLRQVHPRSLELHVLYTGETFVWKEVKQKRPWLKSIEEKNNTNKLCKTNKQNMSRRAQSSLEWRLETE